MKKYILSVLILALMALTIACSAKPIAVLPTSAPPDIGQIVTPDPELLIETDPSEKIPDQVPGSPKLIGLNNDHVQTETKIVGFAYAYNPLDGDKMNLSLILNEDGSALISVNDEKQVIESGTLVMEQLSKLIYEHGMIRWSNAAAEDNAVYAIIIFMDNGEEINPSAPFDKLLENFDIAHSSIIAFFDGFL